MKYFLTQVKLERKISFKINPALNKNEIIANSLNMDGNLKVSINGKYLKSNALNGKISPTEIPKKNIPITNKNVGFREDAINTNGIKSNGNKPM